MIPQTDNLQLGKYGHYLVGGIEEGYQGEMNAKMAFPRRELGGRKPLMKLD